MQSVEFEFVKVSDTPVEVIEWYMTSCGGIEETYGIKVTNIYHIKKDTFKIKYSMTEDSDKDINMLNTLLTEIGKGAL